MATTRINEDEDKSKSKNKVLTNTLLVTVSLIIFILISHLIMNFNQSNNFYKAKDYIAKGKYQEAVQLLEKIQPSDKFETQPLIEKAEKLMESDNLFSRAKTYFNEKNYTATLINYKKYYLRTYTIKKLKIK